MKKAWMVTTLAVFLAWAARADDSAIALSNPPPVSRDYTHRFGAGLIVGEPTGPSLKYWFNEITAIDGAFGASFNHESDHDASFYMHSDILWHNFDLIPVSRGRLPVYLGVGGLLRIRDNASNEAGIRIPVRLSYMFDSAPIDVFVEIGPALDLSPSVRWEVTGGGGVRFWF